MTDTRAHIEELIKSHKVFLFVKTHGPHSREAREALTQAGVELHVKEIDLLPENEMLEFQKVLQEMAGARTVPRVFIQGKCIGGNSDLQQNYVHAGKVKELCH